MTTRSARLAAGVLVGKPAGSIYTSPPGIVTIVKTISVTNASSTEGHVQPYVQTADGSVTVGLEIRDVLPNAPTTFTTWTILEPGDTLNLTGEPTSIAYWVSGTALAEAAFSSSLGDVGWPPRR